MRTLLIAGILFFTVSCYKADLPLGTPDCIQTLAGDLHSEPVQNPPATIWQYTWNGETVYYLPGGCCDMFSQLLDDDCNYICAPDGGFSGAGDGLCPEFNTEKEDPVLIWEDDRE